MNNVKLIIGGAIILILLGIGMFAGWSAHKRFRLCPTITTDTVIVTDPYWHHIADSLANLPPTEIIKWLPQDTLFVPSDSIPVNVDTAAILKDYYSGYEYRHEFKDDTLSAVLTTKVTENKPFYYKLDYNILTPFTTVVNNIDNSVTYSNYLQGGFGIPFKNINYLNLELNYIFPKGYVGGFWIPELKSFGAKAGITILKFNNKR